MNKLRTLLTTIVVLLFSAQICAQTVEINGIWYTLVEKAKTAEVTAQPIDGHVYTGEIVIPSTVVYNDIEYVVDAIGEYAFGSSDASITIPSSILRIEKYAFQNSKISSIIIPNSVTSIEESVFFFCVNLETIIIPKSVKSIGLGVFESCKKLSSVTFLASVTSIPAVMFSGCESLTSISIPNSVTYISSSAFRGCINLSNISIPSKVSFIDSYAFAECASLKSMTLPENLSNLGEYVFSGCTELTDVYCWAENVPTTESTAFEGSYPNYMTLHVPTASISGYESTAPWSSFGTIKSIDNSIATLSVTSGNGGVVTIGQTTIKENTTSVYIKKNNQTEITITPDSDFAIDKVLLDGNDVTSQVVNGNLSITLTADATLTVSFKLNATECTVTMTDDIATFCCAYDLDFTNVSGLKAYLAGGYDKANGKVMLMRVNSVPAGTGLILMGEAGTYEVPYSTSTAFYTNLLKGVTASTTINPTDGSNTNFILANGTNGIGFYAVSSSGELAAGKAYLQLPTSAAQAKSVKMVFEDETTGIVENYEFENKNNDGTVYDLMGRKVKNMTKGMYIMNGKKVIIK